MNGISQPPLVTAYRRPVELWELSAESREVECTESGESLPASPVITAEIHLAPYGELLSLANRGELADLHFCDDMTEKERLQVVLAFIKQAKPPAREGP
jgi:hypothetical protein